METRDVFLAGYAARLIQDRQQAEREALALRAEYMAQVTAYMNQGYSIDEAHGRVQEFYERQAQMQAALARPAGPAQPRLTGLDAWNPSKWPASQRNTLWVVLAGLAVECIYLLFKNL